MFGKIRFMNYNGCKRKFDIDKYVARIDLMVRGVKAAAAGGAAGGSGAGGSKK